MAWVRASCDNQRIPIYVTDTSVLRQVVTLLGTAGAAHHDGGSPRRAPENRQTESPAGDKSAMRETERPSRASSTTGGRRRTPEQNRRDPVRNPFAVIKETR